MAKRKKESHHRLERNGVLTFREIAQRLRIGADSAVLAYKSGMYKLRKHPELFTEVIALIEMRQNLRGEHRVVKSYSKGIEL